MNKTQFHKTDDLKLVDVIIVIISVSLIALVSQTLKGSRTG
jgi:hypothetical protein